VIFDLGLGAPAWPDLDAGRRAAAAATGDAPEQGSVGAGTGATVGKMLGPQNATKGGIGSASVRAGGVTVGALVVVNAGGDVVDPATGEIVAGARDPETGAFANSIALITAGAEPPPPGAQTTLAVVATDAALSVEQANHIASIAHDGLARTIRPVHTMFDGDTAFALATGTGEPPAPDVLTRVAVLAVEAVERATLNAVRRATPLGGLPAAGTA
jgi:L-aminopeptidase/D-esterase-like protein